MSDQKQNESGNSNGNGATESRSARLISDGADALELPMAVLPGSHPCESCGDCCRYIATEIDEPTTVHDYEHIVWYLLHRDVAVYIDWEGDWFIEFRTVCDELSPDATCSNYRERPHICSEFSWLECEKTTQESASKQRFEKPQEFVGWLEKRRPKAYARYQKFRRKLIAKRDDPSPGPSAEEAASAESA